jgi:hypothetical protein
MNTKPKAAFEPDGITLPLTAIHNIREVVPKDNAFGKYDTVLATIREVGLVEPLVVFPLDESRKAFQLLDGHMRLKALRELGRTKAFCLVVIVFRRWAIAMGIREPLDHVIHFSGGLAIAYFLYRIIKMSASWIGPVTNATRYILAFTTACTVAVFWEFGEFASDAFRGTHIQHDVAETLWDLIYGVSGAALCILTIASVDFLKISKKRSHSASSGRRDSA